MGGTQNFIAALKGGASNGILAGGFPYANNFWYVGPGAPKFGRQSSSLENLLASMESGDVALLGPNTYEEGGLVIPAGLDNITLIGACNRGGCAIESPATGTPGLQVLGDGVTLINVGVAGGATSAYSLKVGSQTVSPARFRAYQCKFEGNEGANPAAQVLIQGAGDTILEDCEFAWGVNGLVGDANDDGFPTQTLVRDCWFHDLTTVHIGIAAADHWVELWLYNNKFMRDEAGAAPTDFLLISDNANTGHMAGNFFANATNATGVITIGSGMIYGPNGTEAGWSTARPA